MSTILSIAFINGVGPKATNVTFLKNEDGVSEWAWISNDIASKLRPGMRLEVEQVGHGRVQTTWTDATGNEVPLRTPKMQLFLGGSIVVRKPMSDMVSAPSFTFDEGLDEYAAAYDSKRSEPDMSTAEAF